MQATSSRKQSFYCSRYPFSLGSTSLLWTKIPYTLTSHRIQGNSCAAWDGRNVPSVVSKKNVLEIPFKTKCVKIDEWSRQRNLRRNCFVSNWFVICLYKLVILLNLRKSVDDFEIKDFPYLQQLVQLYVIRSKEEAGY